MTQLRELAISTLQGTRAIGRHNFPKSLDSTNIYTDYFKYEVVFIATPDAEKPHSPLKLVQSSPLPREALRPRIVDLDAQLRVFKRFGSVIVGKIGGTVHKSKQECSICHQYGCTDCVRADEDVGGFASAYDLEVALGSPFLSQQILPTHSINPPKLPETSHSRHRVRASPAVGVKHVVARI